MRYRVPDEVAWVYGGDEHVNDDTVYVVRLPDGLPVVLADISATVWLVASDGHDVAHTLAELTGEDPSRLEADLVPFLDDLCARGLLVATPLEKP